MPRYIDADGLNLYDDLFMSEDTINKSGVYVRYRAVENLIKNAPTVDVAPVVHGKWVTTANIKTSLVFCTNCKKMQSQKSKYCPNCGAKMDKVYKEDEI